MVLGVAGVERQRAPGNPAVWGLTSFDPSHPVVAYWFFSGVLLAGIDLAAFFTPCGCA